MTTIGHTLTAADPLRRQLRAARLLLAGAAAVATLALFGAAPHGAGQAVAASGPSATAPFAADDPDFVNDNDQTPGDVFTQNAQDQSTA